MGGGPREGRVIPLKAPKISPPAFPCKAKRVVGVAAGFVGESEPGTTAAAAAVALSPSLRSCRPPRSPPFPIVFAVSSASSSTPSIEGREAPGLCFASARSPPPPRRDENDDNEDDDDRGGAQLSRSAEGLQGSSSRTEGGDGDGVTVSRVTRRVSSPVPVLAPSRLLLDTDPRRFTCPASARAGGTAAEQLAAAASRQALRSAAPPLSVPVGFAPPVRGGLSPLLSTPPLAPPTPLPGRCRIGIAISVTDLRARRYASAEEKAFSFTGDAAL